MSEDSVFESGVTDAKVLYYVILTLALTRNVWTGIQDPGAFGECSLKKEKKKNIGFLLTHQFILQK